MAELRITGFESDSGFLDVESVKPTIDPDGCVDFGNIDSFIKTDAGFKIEGDFGVVTITGGEHQFTVYS